MERASVLEWDGHKIRVMSAEYLAAIAIRTGRPKDRARLVYLVSLPEFDRGRFDEIALGHGLAKQAGEWLKALGLE